MGDGDSILGAVASNTGELGKDIVKTVVSAPSGIIKGGITQVTGTDSEEAEMKKETEKIRRFQRIKEIEAEMANITRENNQKSGPQINSSNPTTNSTDQAFSHGNPEDSSSGTKQVAKSMEIGKSKG